jgi:acetyltransferase-like isoleucine patch superfamily enzyme
MICCCWRCSATSGRRRSRGDQAITSHAWRRFVEHGGVACRQSPPPAEARDMNFLAARYLSRAEVPSVGCKSVGEKNISIGSKVRIDGFANPMAGGETHIGSDVYIGSFRHLTCGAGLVMSEFSGLSMLYTRSDDYAGASMTNPTVPAPYNRPKEGQIVLGQHVVIGARTMVLPGVTIDEGSAVGALSPVTGSLPAWGICAGVPADRLARPRVARAPGPADGIRIGSARRLSDRLSSADRRNNAPSRRRSARSGPARGQGKTAARDSGGRDPR